MLSEIKHYLCGYTGFGNFVLQMSFSFFWKVEDKREKKGILIFSPVSKCYNNHQKQPSEVFLTKMFLTILQNLQENICVGVFFFLNYRPEAYNFIKKETQRQVCSYEFYENFKDTFFTKQIRLILKP